MKNYAICQNCKRIIEQSELKGGIPREEPPNECPDCGNGVQGPYKMRSEAGPNKETA